MHLNALKWWLEAGPRRLGMGFLFLLWIWVAADGTGTLWADTPSTGKPPTTLIPGGSLDAHEKAGGHLLERHVGKTAEELRSRLQRDTRISAASSFTDRKSADEAVAAALAANQKRIASWLKGDDDRLVVTHSGRKVIGISMSRGARLARDATDVRLVLVRDRKFVGGWRILTGYPEL